MAAFANMAAAEARARELMAAGHATVAHVQRDKDGVISVRVLRPMSASGTTVDGANKSGAWDVLYEDDET